ncbi:MAG: peptidoglycan DD-metalloendopeptidase family protein [Chitinophagaceae bacterium]|nr:peptidoglycan DD-metalloendopeptidase family protein [Chitinophagaceae bacterium]
MIKRALFILFSTVVLSMHASAQASDSREDLQKQEQTLRKELDELNQLLEKTKKNKKNSLGQLEAIRSKISKRKSLINGIAKQVKILDDAIYNNQLDVQKLNKDLDTLKTRYQKSIVFAYKSRSGYEYLNFLFSAGSFNDAVKRITYLKSYRQNREAQANAIDLSQTDLNAKINILGANKKDRLKTLVVQNEQLKVLVVDQKEQDKIVKQLKSKEQEITAQVRQKEAQRRKMQSALLTIIRRETLEAERKEKERLAKLKSSNDAGKTAVKNNNEATASTKTSARNSKVGNVEGGLTSTTDNRPYSALETTEEGREASILFENNKGNLPWPVDRGNVYIHFGVENIPGTKLNRKSDGIELALPKGSAVKSVANGVVKYTGDINGDLTVFIQHGKYFSTYTHLSSINVSKDQEVRAGTLLGRSGINLDGEGALLFMINNEKGIFFDPESWLKNRR